MASGIYSIYKVKGNDGTFNLKTATSPGKIRCMLVTSAYTFSAAHADMTNIKSAEASGTGYTASGAALSSLAVTASSTTAYWDAADTTWAAASVAATGCVCYYSDDATLTASYPIVYHDFTATKTSTAGDFTITWNAGGIIVIS